MRDLVKSAKRDRRDKWKENAQNDHRTGMWFVKTTGELVRRAGAVPWWMAPNTNLSTTYHESLAPAIP